MNDAVADVMPGEMDRDSEAPAASAEEASYASPIRFTYPSGARPLSGYTIRRGLGHGGFGEVYYAGSDGGKEVALKLLRRNLDVELRGIRHCLNLKHPNLLAIHDIREDDQGDKWVVMEYISGPSLDQVIANHAAGMPVEEAMAWIHGIGGAVGYLHDHGIVHRDLKPANIFCDEGLVKIGDYGLSKFISCSRRSGQTESVGTVHYMAPEVANGRYGREIDVYAMGVILYEMLTGRVPFEGESIGEVLMKHLTAAPDVSMLQEPYRSVVARALEKDPEKRFRTVAEMLAALPRPTAASVPCAPFVSVVGDKPPLGAGPPPRAARPTMAYVMSPGEDPIFRAVRQFIQRAYDWWNHSKLNTPMKVILLVVGLVVLSKMAGSLMQVGFVMLALYGCYWVVRQAGMLPGAPPPRPVQYAALSPAPMPTPPMPPVRPASMAPVMAPAHAERRKVHWRAVEVPAEALLLKPKRERLTDLVGSMLGSAVVAVVMCLVMMILNEFRGAPVLLDQFAWLAVVSVAGAWAVLIPAKYWEGVVGDHMLRRFILMVVGMALGVVVYGVSEGLMVSLPYDANFSTVLDTAPPHFYQAGKPLLLAYVALFGTLLAGVRWWKQADPMRTTRMSLWVVVFSVLVAWLAATLWQFPQPWLLMVAGTMSVAIQLSSPWISSRRRSSGNNATA